MAASTPDTTARIRRTGIALSGGGARGVAHIGVLQALEDLGVSPGFISGTSAGAIVGALYAAGHTPSEILLIFKSTPVTRMMRVARPAGGFMDGSQFSAILAEHIPADDFSALQKKLFVSVVNLTRGRFEIKSEGPLFETIIASASVPLIFNPRAIGDSLYVDGGLLNNLPIEPLEERCDCVIGVNVTPIRPLEKIDGLVAVGARTMDLVMWATVEARLKRCHIALEPDTAEFRLYEIGQVEEIYRRGYQSVLDRIEQIRRVLSPPEVSTADQT